MKCRYFSTDLTNFKKSFSQGLAYVVLNIKIIVLYDIMRQIKWQNKLFKNRFSKIAKKNTLYVAYN